MHRIVEITALSLVSILVCWSAATAATAADSAQSKACWTEATQHGLVGDKRDSFHATCLKGALAPERPTRLAEATSAARAVTAPSGADRTVRSKQCNAEAARRRLHDAAFESFRKGCLASAAPVGVIETAENPTKPTPAKPELESLTNTPPK